MLFLNAERFDGITASLGDNVSFYQLLHSDYGVELDSAEETIEAVVAEPREARLLDCHPGSALLRLSRLTTDTGQRPIEYVQSLYRGDRFRFRQHLERKPAGDAGPALRPATLGDADGLADVFIAAWRDAYPGVVEAAILESLDHETIAGWLGADVASPGTTVVAEAPDGSIVGFIRFGEDPEGSEHGYVHSLYVHPRAGGRGTGRRLLEHAVAALEAAGHPTVTLWVFEANERARRFYAAARLRSRRRSPDRARVASERNPPGSRRTQRRRDPRSPGRASPSSARLPTGRRARSAGRASASPACSTRRSPAAIPAGVNLLVVDATGELLHAYGGWSCIVEEPDRDQPRHDLRPRVADEGRLDRDAEPEPRRARRLVARRRSRPPAAGLPESRHHPPAAAHAHLGAARSPRALPPGRRPGRRSARPSTPRRRTPSRARSSTAISGTCCSAGRSPTAPAPRSSGRSPRPSPNRSDWSRTRFRPASSERRLIAATELDGDQRLEPGLVWGEVHDGNAWALGGVAGHAGLFAPAADLGRFVSALLAPEHHPVLSARSIAELTSYQAGGPPDTRALGWQLDASAWGSWPSSTYWHTGFTGTSLLDRTRTRLRGCAPDGGRSPRAQPRAPGRAACGGSPDHPRRARMSEGADLRELTTEQVRPGLRRPRPALGRAARLAHVRRRSPVVPEAVEAAEAQIARAVDGVAAALERGGRLIYVGAGTAGRIGLLDAAEAGPTFSVPPGQVVGLLAGGQGAFEVVGRERRGRPRRRRAGRWASSASARTTRSSGSRPAAAHRSCSAPSRPRGAPAP